MKGSKKVSPKAEGKMIKKSEAKSDKKMAKANPMKPKKGK